MCFYNRDCKYVNDYLRCHIHTGREYSRPSVFVINDYRKVFMTNEEACEYDFDLNPEYHSCKEYSQNRYENNIFEVRYNELTEEQKDYLNYILML